MQTSKEDVIKASVRNTIQPKSQYLKMNDSYLINELTNAVVRKFPSLYNNVSITILRTDGAAKEILYKFLTDTGSKKQEAVDTLVAKAKEVGILVVTPSGT